MIKVVLTNIPLDFNELITNKVKLLLTLSICCNNITLLKNRFLSDFPIICKSKKRYLLA